MAEINYGTENSWRIKENKNQPIQLTVERSWTNRYWRVIVPAMSMTYDTYMSLDKFGKVDISTYDYLNGVATFTSYSLDDIKQWAEENKSIINIKF